MNLLNKRELHKRIVATLLSNGFYTIKHDIPGEHIICEVPTLEMAGCIVAALRERQVSKLALHLLAKKHTATKKRR